MVITWEVINRVTAVIKTTDQTNRKLELLQQIGILMLIRCEPTASVLGEDTLHCKIQQQTCNLKVLVIDQKVQSILGVNDCIRLVLITVNYTEVHMIGTRICLMVR